jgi:hypothetical protein
VVNASPTAAPSTAPTLTGTPAATCTETCSLGNGVGVQSCGEPSTCTLTKCNSGYVVSADSCIPAAAATNFTCTSYQELVLNTSTNQITTAVGTAIPAQDPRGSGVCYYYPLVIETTPLSGSSYLTGTAAQFHDQDVISRDHDVNTGDPTYDWHPYSMAHTAVNFTMSAPRILNITGGTVSGTTFTTTNVQIDNFFLVGVYPQSTMPSTANLASYYSAWGTGDSVITGANNVSGIAFNPAGIDLTTNATNTYPDGSLGNYSNAGLVTTSSYAMIPLNAVASGGTASVPKVSITSLIAPNVSTTIDFRALDCGSGRALSSIYLLVQ